MLVRYLCSIFLAAILAAGATAETRSALVIGNAQYSFGALANPANDASDIAAALRGAGFDVALKLDATRPAMQEAIRTFGETLKVNNGVGLFYFAGHGVQISGENYLIPAGETFVSESDIKTRAVNASEIVDAMASAGSSLNIVVLDACRDNALGNTSTRGLSRIDTNARLFMSFSTSPGSVAADGTGRNSPYTKHLVQAINSPDLSIEETFKRTLKGVYQETHGLQTPWISSSFFGDFVFRSAKQAAAPHGQPSAVPALTGIYRTEGTNAKGGSYTGMVAVSQKGDQFTFKWWVGKWIYDGVGHLAGRMLVVYWGEKTPVVYDIGSGGALRGEWADGKGNERLTRFAAGAPEGAIVREGRYRAEGRNPSGATYTGTVVIGRQQTLYTVDWTTGGVTHHGTGTLEGSLLSVNWGSSTPIVYAVAADGSLKGLYAAGAGEETLQPER